MLDERGVEWDYGIGGASTTEFMTSSGLALSFMDWRDRLTCTTLLTPEQAIAVTLGREPDDVTLFAKTCRLISAPQYGEGCQECSACGEVLDGYLFDGGRCPNCGAKVVDE